jgi:hypothetical protein
MKLNLFNIAIIAPCGQKYLHQLLGTYAAKIRMAIISAKENQKSRDVLASLPKTSATGVTIIAELKYWIPLGTAVNRTSVGLKAVNGNFTRIPKALSYPPLIPITFVAEKVVLTNKAMPAMIYFKYSMLAWLLSENSVCRRLMNPTRSCIKPKGQTQPHMDLPISTPTTRKDARAIHGKTP